MKSSIKKHSSKIDIKYLEISSVDNIYGQFLKNYSCLPNREFHTHENYHEFLFVFKGKLGNEVNGKEQIIEEMQVCFIRKKDMHRHFRVENVTADVYNIGVPIEIFDNTLKYLNIDFSEFLKSDLPSTITLHRNDFGSLKHKIELLQNTEYGTLHGTIFISLLTDVIFLFKTSNIKYALFSFAKDTPDWVFSLIDILRLPENFLGGLPKIIEVSGYSQSYLNRILKRYLNITPTKLLNILKLDYARELLDSENMKVIDVCYKCGFNNEAHFYREFKKQYGISPGKLANTRQLF